MQFNLETNKGRKSHTEYAVCLDDVVLGEVIHALEHNETNKNFLLGHISDSKAESTYGISVNSFNDGINIVLYDSEGTLANMILYKASEEVKRNISDITQFDFNNTEMYLSNVKSMSEKPIYGLGTVLVEVSWKILSELEGFHVADFSNEGFSKLSKRFLAKGYNELKKHTQSELQELLGYNRAVEIQFSEEQGKYCYMFINCQEL